MCWSGVDRYTCAGELAFTLYFNEPLAQHRIKVFTVGLVTIRSCRHTYLSVLLFVQIVAQCCNWQLRWKFRHIPGPAGKPVFGNTQEMQAKQPFKAHEEWQAQYGGVFKVFMMRKPIIVVAGMLHLLADAIDVTTSPASQTQNERYMPDIFQLADPAAVRQIFVKDNNKYLPALGRPLISGSAQQAEQSMMNFTT